MDELERRIAARLVEPFAHLDPPQSLQSRIVRQASTARRKQTVAVAAATAAVAAVLVAVPITVPRSVDPTAPGQGSTSTVTTAPDPTSRVTTAPDPTSAVTMVPDQGVLGDLVDLDAAVRISQELPGQPLFRAMALGADGTVLGAPERPGGDLIDGSGVWRAGPAGGVPELVADFSPALRPYVWAMAASERGYLWPEREQLACLGPGGQGPVHTFGAGWGGRTQFFADGEVFVWSDSWRALVVAEGCGGPVRTIPIEGSLVAFRSPYAYVRSGDTTLLEVNVIDETVRELLADVPDDDGEAYAANARVLAWVDGDALTLVDVRSGEHLQTVASMPYGQSLYHFKRVTVGEQIVVYSAHHQDFDEGAAVAVDLRSGQSVALPGHDAWAAGSWLLWRDREGYLLAPTR